MRKKRTVLVLVAVVVMAVGFLATRARSRAGEKPEIRTAKVERGDVVNTVTATGTLQPLTTVDIKSRAGGRVDVLAVDVGMAVKPGQLIAKIDPTDTLEVVRTARADTDASKAKVSQAQDNLRLQKLQNDSEIRQAEEALNSARARLAQAQKQAQAQPVLTRSSISQAQASYDAAQQALSQLQTATVPQTRAAAQAAADDAAANLAAAEESRRMLEQATLPQELAQARSDHDQAAANVEISRKDLKRQKDLRGQGFISQSDLDTAQNRYDLAVAQAESAKEKMDTIQSEQASSLLVARHKVTQARAAVNSTQSRMQTLDSELNTQLASARAKVAEAQAQLQSARSNSVQDSLKQDDVAAARAAVQQAEANLAGARANALQAKVRAADIETARAGVASSAARLQNADTNYQQTVITAPRAGVILQKYVEQGTIITAGASAIAQGTNIVQLGDISRMFVDVLVDEADIGSIDVGQKVDVTLDAYSAEVFDGKVTRIDPQAQTTQNVTTIKVTVEVENPDSRLKPGMNASCDFLVDRAENVLCVPSEAVKEDEDGNNTVTVLQGEKLAVRKVETGITGGDSIEIKSGLKEGDTVVTSIIEAAGQRDGAGRGQGRGTGGGGRGGFGGGGAMGGMPRGGR